MLESLAANILNRLLGTYVENFDPNQLNVGIWSGDVVLKNLKLRNDCLDALNLPINVKFGVLGNLVLTVPWSNLKNKPVKIIIEDCFLLCTPRTAESYNSPEQVERELRLKLRKLAQWESFNAQKNESSGDADDEKSQSFTQTLLTKIVNNLQITIKNIHVRFEDTACILSKEPCSLGITLSELSAISTDSDWAPGFISIATDITHKLLTLKSLCLYWNSTGLQIENFNESLNFEDVAKKFRESIASSDSVLKDYRYVLKPITGTGKLRVNKFGSTESIPHIDLQMTYDNFGVELGDSEYSNLLNILANISTNNNMINKIKMKQPDVSVSEDPREWFFYVASTVLNEVKEKNRPWTWAHIKKRCDQRREYINLWLQKLQLANLDIPFPSTDKEKAFNELQRELGFEEIVLYRSVARKMHQQYQKENESATNATASNANNASSSSWFSGMWNGKTSTESSKELEMTDEQRKELYDAIEFTESDEVENNINIPKDRVTMKVTSLLKQGSFSINKRSQNLKLGEMIFDNCYFELLQRPESFATSFKLQNFKVEDGSLNTLYKHVVSVKDSESIENEANTFSAKAEPLFEAAFEQNPPDGSASSKVDVKLRSMTVFYHVHFVNEVLRFFNPPKQHMQTLSAIIEAAEATVEGWTTQTRMGLQTLLEEHKTIDMNLDLQTPLIIIPLDPHSWDTPCAVIDAGHITLSSDLVSKEKLKVIQGMSTEKYGQIDGSEINRLMFDRYQLCSQDTQILIGPDVRSTISSLGEVANGNKFSILDKMRLDFTVDISILPKAYNLPRIKVSGRLPQLAISLNDSQYKIMMLLINKCIPSGVAIEEDAPVQSTSNVNDSDEEEKRIQYQLSETLRALDNMKEAEINQKFFVLDFDVRSVVITMHQCKDANSMNGDKLIEILGNDLKFNFVKRAKDMSLDMDMHDVNVVDYVEKPADGTQRYLISSGSKDTLNSGNDLFSLKYYRQQRIVSHEDILIEVFDQDINVVMAQLHLCIGTRSILTLLNYAVTTFVDPTAPQAPGDALKHNEEGQENSPQKLNMTIKMAGVTMDFDENSMKLATWTLSSGEFSILMLPTRMKTKLILGNMELVDTEMSHNGESELGKLVSMADDGEVELSYETFDSAENNRGFDSIFKYNASALQITFLEASINKIWNYFNKFMRMKDLFEKAREVAYNQTPSMETVNNMKLDISIKSPLIKFPRLSNGNNGKYDSLDFYLGDFYVQNNFEEGNGSKRVNHMLLSLLDCKISSYLHLSNGQEQVLDIVEHVGFKFDVLHDAAASKNDPTFRVTSDFEKFSASLTELQLQFLSTISGRVMDGFVLKTVGTNELDEELGFVNNVVEKTPDDDMTAEELLSSRTTTPEMPKIEDGVKVDFSFSAPEVAATIYNKTADCTNLENYGLTKVKFQDIGLKFSLNYDQTMKGFSHVDSFTIEDIRNSEDNKHPELIPKMVGDDHQFKATFNTNMVETELVTTLSVTIENPTVILAMDYMFELKEFYDNSLGLPQTMVSNDQSTLVQEDNDDEFESEKSSGTKFQYIFNMVNPKVILLADPSDFKSEAVVFKLEQLQISSQNITTLMVNNVGVFLSKVNSDDVTKVRLLDDFSSSLVIDQRNSTVEKFLTEIQASIQPLLMRISLRDIRLAMLIFNRAVSLMNKSQTSNLKSSNSVVTTENSNGNGVTTKSVGEGNKGANNKSESNQYKSEPLLVLQGETMNVEVGGLRLVLIGDVHEMPILDMRVDSFEVIVSNWSTELDAMATVECYVNVFNYSRSSWEPLIEPVPISFHLSKNPDNNMATVFDIVTRKLSEITLSSRSIAMLSHIPGSLSGELTLKPRGHQKPYRLINDTEMDLNVWVVTSEVEERKNFTVLKSQTSLPWEFEDWRTVREQLDVDNKTNILGMSVVGTTYKTKMKIDATNEGEVMLVMKPAINGIHSRIICVLESGEDNVKTIIVRSTLTVENTTNMNMEFTITDDVEGATIYEIEPSAVKSIPVGQVYNSQLRIKPAGTEYGWSSESIYWKHLLLEPLAIECLSTTNKERKFYFEVNGVYDEREPLAKIYPRMRIIISPPISIENMLPCSMGFSVFDKKDGGSTFTLLEKGEKIPIHDVSLDNFLLLSVQPMIDGATPSKPSIINVPSKSSLTPESSLGLTMNGNQKLHLKISYESVEHSRAKVIRVYSPYIILNETGKDLIIKDDLENKTTSDIELDESNKPFTTLKMFSFTNNAYKNNRAVVKLKDTDWSIPFSFDAIGQSFDVTIANSSGVKESNLGIHIYEGEGIFSMSKMVTLAPRYIIQNSLEEPIELCDFGSTDVFKLESKQSIPLYNIKNVVNKQLQIRFPNLDVDWSSPFYIKDIGFTHLKVLKKDGTHMLLKIEIILENATIFIRVKDAGDLWPYSVKNYSNFEIIFYQRDPKIVDEYYEADNTEEVGVPEYKPLYYKVPPKSVMSYSWDYPTARQKKIVLTAKGRRREIQLAEIGNLPPMRLPGLTSTDPVEFIDLNVVADGPTQVLEISTYKRESSLYKLKTKNSASSLSINSSRDVFEPTKTEEDITHQLIINMEGFGISFINVQLQELFYVSIRNVELRFNNSDIYETFSWKIGNLQIDDQLFGAHYPNVLYPTIIPQSSTGVDKPPVFSGSISKKKDNTHGVVYYKHLTVLLQELSIQLDEDFLFSLLEFTKFPGAAWNKSSQKIEYQEKVTLPQFKEMQFSSDNYFEIFHIQPTMLHLSFMRSERLSSSDEEQGILSSNQSLLLSLVNILTMTIGNVNDAPIRMNSLYMDNLRVPVSTLIANIKTHYSQQFVYQLHKIIGSADFLGNPVGLFNTISSGVWDMFYEPYKGYMMNDRPGEIGINIAKGGLSFAKKTVFGVSDSMAKFTGSMAKGLSFTQDQDFQESRRLQQRINNNSRNVFATSAQSFATTIGNGLAGMALDPYKGAQKEGASGFIKGLGKGFIGLPTKTAIGFLDLTSNLSQGVKNTTTVLDSFTPSRVRTAKFINHDRIIRPYNLRESQGQYWLKNADGGIYMSDKYLAHVVLPGRELAVIISMQHIVEVRVATEQIMWSTAYQNIQGIVLERDGIHIKLKSQAEYFIPIKEANERKMIYKNISIAVIEYNKYCEATL